MTMRENRWFDDYRVILQVGRYLVNHEGFSADELLSYFEKPWKWDDAYQQMSQSHWAPVVRATGGGEMMPF